MNVADAVQAGAVLERRRQPALDTRPEIIDAGLGDTDQA